MVGNCSFSASNARGNYLLGANKKPYSNYILTSVKRHYLK
jgi:hypothetical protein